MTDRPTVTVSLAEVFASWESEGAPTILSLAFDLLQPHAAELDRKRRKAKARNVWLNPRITAGRVKIVFNLHPTKEHRVDAATLGPFCVGFWLRGRCRMACHMTGVGGIAAMAADEAEAKALEEEIIRHLEGAKQRGDATVH